MALNGRYFQEAERLLEQGDYPQASEKFWGAVATALKAVATGKRWRRSSHRDLRAVIRRLYRETRDAEYLDFFSTAETLHANFCEDFLDGDEVHHYAELARRLVAKLQATAG